MKPFIEQAQSYAAYHTKPITRYTHMIGVPLIVLSLMILLGFVHVVIIGVFDLNLAEITTIAVLVYYFFLNVRLALATTPIIILLLWLATFFSYGGPSALSLWAFAILFFSGGILQLVGHFIEGKRPALTDHLWYVVIAPLYLVAELFFMVGRMQELKVEIHAKEPEKAHNNAS